MNNFFLVIMGPTGVGKTELVEELAVKTNGGIEIINGDLGQCYAPLSVGTAKPDWRASIYKHHLFDCIDEPKDFNVVDFRHQVKSCLQEGWKRTKVPVVVGGSSFYIKSLFFPPHDSYQSISLENSVIEQGAVSVSSWEYLAQLDPRRAANIHCHDSYRIERAIALYKQGIMPSQYVPDYSPLGSFLLIYLDRLKDDLDERINKRVLSMLDEGWLAEVMALSTPWMEFLQKKKFIGYPELIAYRDDKRAVQQSISTIQAKTRRYAKRQRTFWRSFKKQLIEQGMHDRIVEINLTLSNHTLYIDELLKRLEAFNGH